MVSLPPAAGLTDLSKGVVDVPTGAVQKVYRCSGCHKMVKKLVLAKPCVESYCSECEDDTEWTEDLTHHVLLPPVGDRLCQEYRCGGCDVPKKFPATSSPVKTSHCPVCDTDTMWRATTTPPPPSHETRLYRCTSCSLKKTLPLSDVFTISYCPSCGGDAEWGVVGEEDVPCNNLMKYRCQGCNESVKKLGIEKVHIESYCGVCGDDTEWIIMDVQVDGEESDSTVKLVVDGRPFYAATETFLDQREETLFSVLCSRKYDVVEDGGIEVDRPSKWFQNILDFCRQGTLVGSFTFDDLCEIEEEARYYCLTQLVDHVREMKGGGDPAPVVRDCNVGIREATFIQNDIRAKLSDLNQSLSQLCPGGEPTRLLHESCTDLLQVTTTVLTEAITTLHRSLPPPSDADWAPSVASSSVAAPPPTTLVVSASTIIIPRSLPPETVVSADDLCKAMVFCGVCSAASALVSLRRW